MEWLESLFDRIDDLISLVGNLFEAIGTMSGVVSDILGKIGEYSLAALTISEYLPDPALITAFTAVLTFGLSTAFVRWLT